jgi:tetratricopeptide (TPR) repeat protein
MAQKITPQSMVPASTPSHLTGEEPSPFFHNPLEFHRIHPLQAAPAYTSSQRQIPLPGEGKTKVVGAQHLGGRKRAVSHLSNLPAVESKKPAAVHENGMMDQAEALFNKRDYPCALKAYEVILQHEPKNQAALYRKSRCCWMLGYLKEAKECLDYLLLLYPKYAQAWARRGALLIQQQKYPEALADLRQGFALVKIPGIFVEYAILLDCYDSFANTTDTTAFHLQHASYDFQGNPQISQDDLHLLRGIFFASYQNYHSAIHELSLAAEGSSNLLAQEILRIVQNIYRRRGHIAKQSPSNVTLQARRIPISALLNDD